MSFVCDFTTLSLTSCSRLQGYVLCLEVRTLTVSCQLILWHTIACTCEGCQIWIGVNVQVVLDIVVRWIVLWVACNRYTVGWLVESDVVDGHLDREEDHSPVNVRPVVGDTQVHDNGHWFLTDSSPVDVTIRVQGSGVDGECWGVSDEPAAVALGVVVQILNSKLLEVAGILAELVPGSVESRHRRHGLLERTTGVSVHVCRGKVVYFDEIVVRHVPDVEWSDLHGLGGNTDIQRSVDFTLDDINLGSTSSDTRVWVVLAVTGTGVQSLAWQVRNTVWGTLVRGDTGVACLV